MIPASHYPSILSNLIFFSLPFFRFRFPYPYLTPLPDLRLLFVRPPTHHVTTGSLLGNPLWSFPLRFLHFDVSPSRYSSDSLTFFPADPDWPGVDRTARCQTFWFIPGVFAYGPAVADEIPAGLSARNRIFWKYSDTSPTRPPILF